MSVVKRWGGPRPLGGTRTPQKLGPEGTWNSTFSVPKAQFFLKKMKGFKEKLTFYGTLRENLAEFWSIWSFWTNLTTKLMIFSMLKKKSEIDWHWIYIGAEKLHQKTALTIQIFHYFHLSRSFLEQLWSSMFEEKILQTIVLSNRKSVEDQIFDQNLSQDTLIIDTDEEMTPRRTQS